MTTPYHAKYFAHELTKRHSANDPEKFAGTLVDAQVDLNPHQVDAALFAFSSPLSRGALLADEVGLGKTIEAGMVISQRWAERKRRIPAIILPICESSGFRNCRKNSFYPARYSKPKITTNLFAMEIVIHFSALIISLFVLITLRARNLWT